MWITAKDSHGTPRRVNMNHVMTYFEASGETNEWTVFELTHQRLVLKMNVDRVDSLVMFHEALHYEDKEKV
jgi:outer membrane biogenesis lipoprotein LolB